MNNTHTLVSWSSSGTLPGPYRGPDLGGHLSAFRSANTNHSLTAFCGADGVRGVARTGELPKHLAPACQLRFQLLILTAQGVVVLRQPLFVSLQLLGWRAAIEDTHKMVST